MKIKKYQFELEALLKIRTIEEEKALQDLSEIIAKINSSNEEIKVLEQQYKEELKKFEVYLKSDQANMSFQSFTLFLNRLNDTKKKVQRYIESIQPELEKKRKKLLEVRKNKRILEILKEKRLQEYKKELNKLEKKELFEINQKIGKKDYENLEQDQTEIFERENFEESTEDLRTRRDKESREYFKRK